MKRIILGMALIAITGCATIQPKPLTIGKKVDLAHEPVIFKTLFEREYTSLQLSALMLVVNRATKYAVKDNCNQYQTVAQGQLALLGVKTQLLKYKGEKYLDIYANGYILNCNLGLRVEPVTPSFIFDSVWRELK